jgi:hypothetical protein
MLPTSAGAASGISSCPRPGFLERTTTLQALHVVVETGGWSPRRKPLTT